ncbi:MAG: hypothetical protein HY680_02530 [Chloroflexi bacterium]|nr:hypothetical protein [Chloroflexota bacterium]
MEQAIAVRRPSYSNISMIATAAAAALAVGADPFLFRRFADIDPAVVSTLGNPSVFLVNVIGSLTLFLPMPGLAVVFAGGSALNPFVVAIVAAPGMALGMVACYLLGVSGSPLIQNLTASQGNVASKVVSKVHTWFQRYGVWAGAIRMPLWKFAVGTFPGKVAQTSVVALAGTYLALAVRLVA